MGGTIHVNTDQLRQLGARFMQANDYIRDQLIPDLQRVSAQAESDWVGASRQRYDELLQQWTQSAQSLLNWGIDIGRHVSSTADYFDNADHSV